MSMPIVVLFGTFTLLCAWSLTSLLVFHGMIISLAQTTNERVRNVYQYGNQNVDNHGCVQNWCYALCSKRRPSLLPNDFSEFVTCGVCQESVWSGSEIGSTNDLSTLGGAAPPAMSDAAVANGNGDTNNV